VKNILITGANGFIGKYLVKNFKCTGYTVLYGTTSRIRNTNYYNFNNLYSDIDEILKNTSIDIIIHLASIIPISFDKANIDLFIDNTKMMHNLSEFASKKKVKKFIYLSSFGSMNNVIKYDIKDYYTLSKIMGEHICSIMESKGIETASLRISSPFGEFNKKNNVLNMFIDSALLDKDINVYGRGEREQNFIYVGNINECIQRCIEYKVNGIYDLVNKSNINMISLAQVIVKLTNSKSKIVIGGKDDPLENTKLCNFSLDRVKKELHYEETISFEDAIVNYIKWKKENI